MWFGAGITIGAVVVWGLWWWQNPWFARAVWLLVALRLPTLIEGAFLGGALILLLAGALCVRALAIADAETFGYRIGEAILPLAVAAWGARRFSRRHGRARLSRAQGASVPSASALPPA